MAKHGEGQAWFGKTCAKCEAPLNYAQAAKGAIPGLCGKCTDEVRRRILGEARQPSGRFRRAEGFDDGGGRGAPFALGLVAGLIIAAAAGGALYYLDKLKIHF